jgi:hypothetical protein
MAGGGGGATTCMPACQPWQVCDVTVAPVRCGNGEVVVLAPDAGLVVGTGEAVPLWAELRYDGGVVAVRIPVENDFGARATTVVSGMASTQAAPPTAGLATFSFGWDGGPTASRTVEVRGCNGVTCGAWQSCTGTVDGGRCEAAVTALQFVAPDGGPYGPGVMVPVAVAVTLVDGGVFGGDVPLGGAATATLTGTGNTKTGTVTTPGVTGPFQLVAGWDGGATATVTSFVDARRPVVTVTVEDAPARTTAEVDAQQSGPKVYRRDETARLKVEADEDADFSGVMVAPTATSVAGGQCTGCTNGLRCRCYQLNLAGLPFPALRGAQGYSVRGVRDGVGNVSEAADGGVQVTRWKWGGAVPDGLSVRAAPALDSAGRLYVGTINANNNNNGNVYQYGARGEVVTFLAGAGAVQAVAVAETRTASGRQELVYVASNTASGGDVRARNVDGGTTGVNATNCAFYATEVGARLTYTALALFDAGVTGGGMEVGAVALFNPLAGQGGTLCAYRPAGGAVVLQEPLLADGGSADAWEAPAVPTPAATPTNLVAVDNTVYLLQGNRVPRRFDWSSPTNLAFTDFGSGPAVATLGTPVGLVATPQRLFASLTGTTDVFVSMDRAGAQVSAYTNAGLSGLGPAVLGPSTSGAVPLPALAYASTGVGTGTWAEKLLVSRSANVAPTTTGGLTGGPAGVLETAVVLGEKPGGAATDVLLYAVRRGGRLQVLSVTGAGVVTAEWDGVLFAGTPTVYAPPTLDCGRAAPGTPGVLYVVTTDGNLAALVVDSPRLATAPWPRWQATAGNAGNPGFPLNPGCQ